MKAKHLVVIAIAAILLGNNACSSDTSELNNTLPANGLTVTATTSTTGGGYSPRNVVAVWIETDQSIFVKSLLVKAKERKADLTHWYSSSSGNSTDAITGATMSKYGTVSCNWDGRDKNGNIMPDGNYKVCMEITDKSATGNFSSFSFSKASTSETQTPANQPSFSSISIKWVPLQ